MYPIPTQDQICLEYMYYETAFNNINKIEIEKVLKINLLCRLTRIYITFNIFKVGVKHQSISIFIGTTGITFSLKRNILSLSEIG
jgi:hypothetical protein